MSSASGGVTRGPLKVGGPDRRRANQKAAVTIGVRGPRSLRSLEAPGRRLRAPSEPQGPCLPAGPPELLLRLGREEVPAHGADHTLCWWTCATISVGRVVGGCQDPVSRACAPGDDCDQRGRPAWLPRAPGDRNNHSAVARRISWSTFAPAGSSAVIGTTRCAPEAPTASALPPSSVGCSAWTPTAPVPGIVYAAWAR